MSLELMWDQMLLVEKMGSLVEKLPSEKKKKADAVGINKGGTAELTSSLESGVVL